MLSGDIFERIGYDSSQGEKNQGGDGVECCSHVLHLRYAEIGAPVGGCDIVARPEIRFRVCLQNHGIVNHVSVRAGDQFPFFHVLHLR